MKAKNEKGKNAMKKEKNCQRNCSSLTISFVQKVWNIVYIKTEFDVDGVRCLERKKKNCFTQYVGLQ
jgi:hypothetical protein